MPNNVTFNVGVWYSGTPEQFLLHVKQALHAVKWAGLVDKYYSARTKRETAQKEWDKVMTSIVKYKKDNKEKGPFRDYEAILKELKKEQDAFVKTQMEAEAKCVVTADGIFTQYANLLSVEQQGAWEKMNRRSASVTGRTYVAASTIRNVVRHISTFSNAPRFICRPSSMKTPWNVSRFI